MSDKIKKMKKEHNKFVKEQLDKAKNGETIDLTELFISKENVQEAEEAEE